MLGDDDYSSEALIAAYEQNTSSISVENTICTESAKSFETFSKKTEQPKNK